MKTLHFRSRSGADGLLKLTVPVGTPDSELDVVVVLSPVPLGGAGLTQAEWSDAIARSAGSVADASFQRHEQGEYEKRDELG